MMSDINKKYGKEIKRFKFDGSYPGCDAIVLNGSFIVYENGLLIKGLTPESTVYVKWKEMSHVILYNEEITKVAIGLENEDGEIVAESRNKPGDIEEFYDLIFEQKEKYRNYDSLKKLEVDLEELSIIMDTDRWEHEVYLDTETGEIIYIPVELDEENIYEEEYISSLPEWEKEMVEDVKAIYEDEEERYVIIPERSSSEAYEKMVRFTKTLNDSEISRKLFDALDGRGAFRRFKDILRRYPQIENQWYKYKEELEKQEVRKWLWGIGIDPVEKK
ncbi:MAG: hypothetical protein HPY74_20365 [Firmicutes bacterium]|nr:hypothetical protein [Bacillota bacterium]